jgi:tetratricopeptide (TPR) repeat protein
MSWKDLLKIENLSVRNPMARIFYSAVPIVSSTALLLAQQNANSQTDSGLTTAAILLAPIAGVAGNTLAEAISNKYFSKFKRSDILQNGDLHKAVGDAICATVLLAFNQNRSDVNSKVLKKLSKVPTDIWQELIEELEKEEDTFQNLSIEEIDRLYPKNLPDIFAIPTTEFNKIAFLDKKVWEKVLRKLCNLYEISTSNDKYPNFPDTISFAAEELEKNFCEVLKHTIITNITKDGKAYANLQMKMVGEILYYVRETQTTTIENKTKLEAIEKKINLLCTALENGLSPDSQNFDDSLEQIKQEIIANQQIIFDYLKDIQSGVQILVSGQELINETLRRIEEAVTNQPKPQIVSDKLPVKLFPSSLPYFTGREDVLRKIGEALDTSRLASLDGIHGLGKSSVVNEFANNLWQKKTPVIFIRATRIELDTYISEVVKDLQLPLSETPTTEEILNKFRNWLATNKDWLLILDNVDEVRQITDCHFPFDNGYVLLTSNNAGIHAVGHKVEIKNMSAEDAMLLLYRHYKESSDLQLADIPAEKLETVREIAAKFGNSPLAMSFVGSYLAVEQESFTDFLTAYEDREENLLTKYQFLSTYQHKEVATAYLQTFESITTPKDDSENERFIAHAVEDYLKLCVYLSPDNIPEELLQKCLAKLYPEQAELSADNKIAREIRKRLKSYSLFERDSESKTLSTHRIVQEVMRFQIKNEEIPLLKVIAETIKEQMPFPNYTNTEIVTRYLTHQQFFLEYLERNEEIAILRLENEDIANLCNRFARYNELFGQYETAAKYYEKFKDLCEKIPEIEETIKSTSYNNLAELFRVQGRYEEAEPLHKKALVIHEKVLGLEHPETATSYNNSALLYRIQGRYEEAELLHKKALDIRENVLGLEHPETATSYNNLAELFRVQGRYEEAEPLCEKALVIRENVLGLEHPDTAQSYNNSALLYQSQGRYEEAELLHKKVISILEKVLGLEHPNTATSFNNLGMFYAAQGKFAEAKEYLEKALVIFQIKLGENHPNTIRTKKNLEYLKEVMK